jgi:hypothetical protein
MLIPKMVLPLFRSKLCGVLFRRFPQIPQNGPLTEKTANRTIGTDSWIRSAIVTVNCSLHI